MTLAARLLSAMRRRGIRSQSQLARLSGVSQPSVHRILADPHGYMPGRRVLARLAQALNMSETWLADGNASHGAFGSSISNDARSLSAHRPLTSAEPHDTATLSRLCDQLSPAQRALLLDMARMLCKTSGRVCECGGSTAQGPGGPHANLKLNLAQLTLAHHTQHGVVARR
ncbi:MAG: helix-turn-helix transcriptional regulator [Burkholderiaceae bacterium]|nr:helix-turn-helix transcriptional regulator [Burkholderiaceae bacterium]